MSDSIIEKAPQTSEAQSGDTLKIAAVAKTKDPRRVTAGKRMVEINWREKEREMRGKIESEKAEDSTFNYSCIVVAALAVGAAGAYYPYKIY